MPKAYKLLLMDLDDTLLDFQSSQRDALNEVLDAVGIGRFPEVRSHYERINRDLWKKYEQGSLSKHVLFTERWVTLFRQYGCQACPREANNHYLSHLAENPQWLDGAKEFFFNIARRYRTVIVTNGNSTAARRRISLLNMDAALAACIISEEVGVAKPHPAIFSAALAHADGIDPADALMIGDNFHADIVGAQAFGLDTCWFYPGAPKPHEKKLATFHAKSHRDIIDWLDHQDSTAD